MPKLVMCATDLHIVLYVSIMATETIACFLLFIFSFDIHCHTPLYWAEGTLH